MALQREANQAVDRYIIVIEPMKGGFIGWSSSFQVWMSEQPTQSAALAMTRQKIYDAIMQLLESKDELPDPKIERAQLIILRSQLIKD
jgi:hypothetical protein